MSYIEVVRIHDPFPECGKERLFFRIDCSWNDEIFHITKSLIDFLNICSKHDVKPDIEFYSDIMNGSRHIKINVRGSIDKINNIHIEWNEYADSKKDKNMDFDTNKITSVRNFPSDESNKITMNDVGANGVRPDSIVTINFDDVTMKKIDTMCEDIKNIKTMLETISYKISDIK